ncbi:hypothetical protein HC256_000243 [Beauveria bassiana]|nr:hypothetical protein HC256_000243 [Beauveria bassiana]
MYFSLHSTGGQFYATDIPVRENEAALGLDVLEKSSRPWWKQFSLYSAVTVQQVQMRFMSIEPAGIGVCIVPLDYTDDMHDLNQAIKRELQDVERGCCDIGSNAEECLGCPNTAYDEDAHPYCKIQQSRKLRRMHTEYKWLPSTLKYWWHNGIDARVLLIEGWNARYILVLTGLTILGSACVIAIMAARTGSIENALTAGSYACGLGGTLIAVLTLLSALLR